MANVREMNATARSGGGTGAARAERRSGRVPAIIYGDNQTPTPISLDLAEVRQRIYAGHFLTTIYDLNVEGKKQRVIPRDYQMHPVHDTPMHVDFMRLGEGATIRVSIPIHVRNAEASPGVKRGGAVNIVTHAVDVRCPAEAIPESIDVDLTGLEIARSVHLSEIKLPEGVVPLTAGDQTLVTIVPPSGYLEEQRAAAAAAGAAGAEGAAPAEAAAGAGAAATGGEAKKS